jgi:hypothetical protein
MTNGTERVSINAIQAVLTASAHWALDSTNFLLVSGTGGDYSGYSGEVTISYTKV